MKTILRILAFLVMILIWGAVSIFVLILIVGIWTDASITYLGQLAYSFFIMAGWVAMFLGMVKLIKITLGRQP